MWHIDDIKKVKPMWHGVDPKYQRRNGEDDLALVPGGKAGGKGGNKKRRVCTAKRSAMERTGWRNIVLREFSQSAGLRLSNRRLGAYLIC